MTKNMILKFLGIGSAFSQVDLHSNALLTTESNKTLLIDCGSDIRHSMRRAQLSIDTLTDVFITHAHQDHVGGLEWLGFLTYFSAMPRPKLYAYTQLMEDISMMVGPSMFCIDEFQASLATYFDVNPVNNTFTSHEITFELVPILHTTNHGKINSCHGLFFHSKANSIWITADCQFQYPQLQERYEQASIIFHDCDTGKTPSPVHTHITELMTLPTHIKQKIWLCNYDATCGYDAKRLGFKGFVEPLREYII